MIVVQVSLVDFVVTKMGERQPPETIQTELSKVLDDEAEVPPIT